MVLSARFRAFNIAPTSIQIREKSLSKNDREDLDRLLPIPLWMSDLVVPMAAWAVRMKRFDPRDNQVFGAMIWPEVLFCKTQRQAEGLRRFLDDASYQDYLESALEEDSSVDPLKVLILWREEDIAQYVIEHVPNIQDYAELDRVGESMSTIRRLFPTLEGMAALRRYR